MTDTKAERVVQVGLGDRSYPIFIQEGTLDLIGRDLQERKVAKRYGVISDDHVASLYGQQLLTSLAEAGIAAELITFPHGEASKNLKTICWQKSFRIFINHQFYCVWQFLFFALGI